LEYDDTQQRGRSRPIEDALVMMEDEFRHLIIEERKAEMILKLEQKCRDIDAIHVNITELRARPAPAYRPPSSIQQQRHSVMTSAGPPRSTMSAASEFSPVYGGAANGGLSSVLGPASDQSNMNVLQPPTRTAPLMPLTSQSQQGGSPLNRMDLNPHVYLDVPSDDATPQGNKYRAIVDFIPKNVRSSDEEVEIAKGVVLKMKANFNKVRLDQVTPAQWVAANSRIMADIIQKECGTDIKTFVLDYLAYTAKIGELATKFTWSSVMRYDDEYRTRQSCFGFPWGSDSPHMLTVNLDRRVNQGQPLSNPAGATKSQKSRETPYCINFNNGKECPFKPCKFRHVCETCGKGHAKVNHDSVSGAAGSAPDVASKA
jgi:hypothetical protein